MGTTQLNDGLSNNMPIHEHNQRGDSTACGVPLEALPPRYASLVC